MIRGFQGVAVFVFASLLISIPSAQAAPTVFPTGTTIYQPDKTWNGFTVLSVLDTQAVQVIDMNGKVVKRWNDFNVSAGGPARILPNGIVVASAGANPGHQEGTELRQEDFNGNTTWRFDSNEQIPAESGGTRPSARQHHDWQRSDFPAGYYSPSFTPAAEGVTTLLLTHTTHTVPAVADIELEDDRLIEIDWQGNIRWEWKASDHIDAFGFNADERAAIRNSPTMGPRRGPYDWFHINSATYVGPNQWYDAGDQRFAPDNVIISSRQSSLVAIVSHQDGSIVWQLGPDFSRDEAQWKIGQIIGQHHAHFIPPGLPGAGHVMIFDNGGSSGYGKPGALTRSGQGVHQRSNSRVLEINPTTLEVVWSYTAPNFFSTNISSAQRLPNGNTLITEGAPGRVFEVTAEKQIVWEYMAPPGESARGSNAVYRAYRIPYGWIPQLAVPQQRAVTPPKAGSFMLPAD
ncbi:MAG: aryl-sulfate sulfotransferase [Gammaproteobacteria bacterium]|nr:aryl-sulfate sulfotransferase [Gammaproteobacteria bacterium]